MRALFLFSGYSYPVWLSTQETEGSSSIAVEVMSRNKLFVMIAALGLFAVGTGARRPLAARASGEALPAVEADGAVTHDAPALSPAESRAEALEICVKGLEFFASCQSQGNGDDQCCSQLTPAWRSRCARR